MSVSATHPPQLRTPEELKMRLMLYRERYKDAAKAYDLVRDNLKAMTVEQLIELHEFAYFEAIYKREKRGQAISLLMADVASENL